MSDYIDLAEIALRIIEKSLSKPKTRRSFSKYDKTKIKKIQKNRCKACGKKSDVLEIDHVDGNSSNNSFGNGQALCPNCHSKKTRNIKQRKLKLSQFGLIQKQLSFTKNIEKNGILKKLLIHK